MSVIHQVYGYFMPTVNLMGAGAAQETGKQARRKKSTIGDRCLSRKNWYGSGNCRHY